MTCKTCKQEGHDDCGRCRRCRQGAIAIADAHESGIETEPLTECCGDTLIQEGE